MGPLVHHLNLPPDRLASRRALRWTFSPVNASELLDAVSALPSVRVVPTNGHALTRSVIVGGVEVGQAQSADERALRRAWRERTEGGPVPLLLLADDPAHGGTLRTLGPLGGGDPIRSVRAQDLLEVLERVSSASRLRAVRELAEELTRLDRSGVAGFVIRGLGTEHLYRRRLRLNESRWAELGALASGVEGEWRQILQSLGYDLKRRPRRGWLARYERQPVAVVHPLEDPAEFAKLDPEGRPREGALLNDCIEAGAPYGLLVSGSRLRLFEAQPTEGSSVGRYLELDAATLSPEDRPLLGLLSARYLAEGGLDALLREARAFGGDLRERIDRAIRQDVLPALGRELGRWAEEEGLDLGDDDVRSELQAAALTLVFRLLFILYAESAGHLPVEQQAYEPHSLSRTVLDARDRLDRLSPRSATLWRRVHTLVEALREGDPSMAVPAYNGALFSPDGFEGAAVLERARVSDAAFGPALVALGVDPETGSGVDFSGLSIGHLGHIYEGLLSLRLSVADRAYRYDARADRYVAATEDEAEIEPGELLWLTDEGGRKGGGVYYTPEPLVRHLVRRAVLPAFEEHLDGVQRHAREDPRGAAEELFRFRVLDPACGSAHFLVAVVDELADRTARFLASTPLRDIHRMLDDLRAGAGATYGAGIDDLGLLRRLLLKRCVYGVDVSPMGAEIAKLSLWLASFVPGLSLAYLDHNVRVGNALIGVADVDHVREPGEACGQVSLVAQLVRDAVQQGAEAAAAILALPDRTPEEVAASATADRELRERVNSARRLLNLWVAEPLGVEGARNELWAGAAEIAAGRSSDLADEADRIASARGVFHWPLEFPEVFADGDAAGFDAVVGNPPWEEITVEELAFYARYQPGLRGLSARDRDRELRALKERRPELASRFEAELERTEALRAYFGGDTGYEGSPGDPDLYKFFCQRYRLLPRDGGSLGVVLPRSAFSTDGSAGFRSWLFGQTHVRRLDFLLNKGKWMFDAEPRYTVTLVVASTSPPGDDHRFEVAGVADSAERFAEQSAAPGLTLGRDALGGALEVPLLPSQRAADLLAKLRRGEPFARGGGRWLCFPVAELHETNDRRLWERARPGGRQLWKGESFGQYDPHGAEARWCPASEAVMRKIRKPRPGQKSLVAAVVSTADRAAAVARETEGARVAFRDVARATDSRTVIAALIPPRILLTNKAPYLAFVQDRDLDRACCLGVMNSLVFDWQARRFVEINLNFFILEGLCLPSLDDETYVAIARAAARLSCVDDRFADFARSTGVDCGPLDPDEHERLRVEIDALVARAWELTADDLETVLEDFTLDAVPESYRDRLRGRFAELLAAS